MKLKKLIDYLESIAPPAYQESYDNSGLIVGDANMKIKGVMICLDSTESVLAEAIKKKCNVIIAHHPIVFRGLKKLNGRNYVERVVMKAIRNDIAIYAIHTNLDNVYHSGVNAKIAQRLKLKNTRILVPKSVVKKLSTYVPISASDQVRNALFAAGAGSVSNAEALSYASVGMSTHHQGTEAAVKIEVLFAQAKESAILRSLMEHHPSRPVPYDIHEVNNVDGQVGSGMIGELKRPMKAKTFFRKLKKKMKVNTIRHTRLLEKNVQRIAVCGGAGGFLLPQAIGQGAELFITADYKYHEFFDADGQIVIADIGHYESEQFTIELLFEIITNKFSTFAAHCTKVNTNPIYYL